jgi:choline-sulfatase
MSEAPNVVIVMADQLVPFLTGPYGSSVARTPAMDALAADGVVFDAAYTAVPLCAPSRAAMLTGRDASAIGSYDNASVMPSDIPTLGHYLTNAGYDTVLSGKLHFVGPDQLHGFAERLTTDVFPANLDWVPAVGPDGRFPAGGHARHYADPDPGVHEWTQFLTFDEETRFAAATWLRERSLAENPAPFGMVVSFHHPHDPFHVRQEYWDRYEGVDIPIPEAHEGLEATRSVMDVWANEAHETEAHDLDDPGSLTRMRRAYLAAVSYVDDLLGDLVTALRETGELENTIVVVTSDHGDMLGERRMVQKRCFYEWSARVPLLVRLPGAAEAGRRVPAPVSLVDLLPTLLDLTGVSAAGRAPMDGDSLMPELSGRDRDEERPVFSEYHLEKVWAPCFMVRRGGWKYIHIVGHPGQLFDLEHDPGEWENLSGRPEVAAIEEELRALVLARFDVERLERESAATIVPRQIVAEAMRRSGTRWDYSPTVDGTRRFVR